MGECVVIFVTVGTHYQGFERLVRKMDEIAEEIDEEVIIQIGHTKFKPFNAEYFDFRASSEIEMLNREARVVVSHAGVGSIITALRQNRGVIIVPRLREFDEIIDNHQMEISEALSNCKMVKVVYNISDLTKCLDTDFDINEMKEQNSLSKSIEEYLSAI